ncbi:Enoyl-CoA hydratase/carnithine racemase [Frankia canadensis]|uniref:Enoyl-CoA hydratase/carnithine racemase n=1 Tax=Frankia canadensis TaxID=1836972 RepID=A0A2I2KM53_9ACTN|nr:enoyl-CoA hydratase-related protein [Frankia canadensis]SNQ46740.1 Enoyl-CoA hydratase/carnithine racemase [Frankia canadensis]SOU54030.1 Enoyl-CoA hydratase/carnithine racemase [Frankia canadensis]
MTDALVHAEAHGRVLVISMLREKKRNAVDRAMADELDVAFNRLDDDPELWVGVLTGTGRAFSAGSDLSAGGDYSTERGGEYGIIRRTRRKPLIAAIEALALGGGLEIAMACDLVVAARDARLGLPEVVRGLLPTSGALFRALQVFPVNLARELVLLGEPISAQRACDAGFVNVVAEPGQALPAALDLAERLARHAPLSVQASLAAMNGLLAAGDEAGWAATGEALDSVKDSADLAEGVRAFLEKRPPVWTGR